MLGETISHYRILEKLGEGGMGEVYLAEDTRLGRRVALKFLAPELARDKDALVRFRNEARAAAELSHPNIATIYDVGETDGKPFLVIEYLEGHSLRERVARGPLPLDEVVRVGRAIAAGLAKAHAHGIVHRDIKSANVMFTTDGDLKILDFGLAHRADATRITRAGTRMGTINYMSPEQVRGEAADRQSDLWALGVVLYECATGRLPFRGEAPASIFHQIESTDVVPPRILREDLPEALEATILRCLARDRADRWASADELRAALAGLDPEVSLSRTGPFPVEGVPGRRSRVPGWAVAALVAVSAMVVFFVVSKFDGGGGGQAPGGFETRRLTWGPELELDPAISPDGTMLAYASGRLGAMRIAVRQFSGGRELLVAPELEGDQRRPRWSTDGQSIMFFAGQGHSGIGVFTGPENASGRELYVVPALGGVARRVGLPGSSRATDAAWSPDGRTIAYAVSDSLYLHDVAADRTRALAGLGVEPTHGIGSIAWHPDGGSIAIDSGNVMFAYNMNAGRSQLWVVSTADGSLRPMRDDGSLNTSPRWSPDGRDLYFISSSSGIRDVFRIGAQGSRPGNADRMTVGMSPHSIDVAWTDGSLVASTVSLRSNVWAVDLESIDVPPALRQVTFGDHQIEGLDVSRDGRWLVFDSGLHGNHDLFVADLETGSTNRITSDPAHEFYPQWSPDASLIACYSLRSESRNLQLVRSDGTGVRMLTEGPFDVQTLDWSADGRSILLWSDRGGVMGYYVVRGWDTGGGSLEWVHLAGVETEPGAKGQFSPDGEWVLVTDPEGFCVIASTGDSLRAITLGELGVESAVAPRWSGEGDQLYFVGADAQSTGIWRHDLATGSSEVAFRFPGPEAIGRRLETAFHDGTFYLIRHETTADIWALSRPRVH